MNSDYDPIEDCQIRKADCKDRPEWAQLRTSLWPECSTEQHALEIESFFADRPSGWAKSFLAIAAFVAVRPDGRLSGFIEVSLRSHVENCPSNPVAYIEGWFVIPEMRGQKIGRALITAAETWAVAHGCSEIASDCELGNTNSLNAHLALDFEESARLIHLRKRLTRAT